MTKELKPWHLVFTLDGQYIQIRQNDIHLAGLSNIIKTIVKGYNKTRSNFNFFFEYCFKCEEIPKSTIYMDFVLPNMNILAGTLSRKISLN